MMTNIYPIFFDKRHFLTRYIFNKELFCDKLSKLRMTVYRNTTLTCLLPMLHFYTPMKKIREL